MIQLGVPIADAPAEGENMTGASKGKLYCYYYYYYYYYYVIFFRYQSTIVHKSFLFAVFYSTLAIMVFSTFTD